MRLSTIDSEILNCIQEDIPLESKPFEALAKMLGIEEDRLLKGISRLKDKGIIRSFPCERSYSSGILSSPRRSACFGKKRIPKGF